MSENQLLFLSILAQIQRSGVLKLAELFNAEDISFKQILQDGKQEGRLVSVIITHKINKAQLENITASLKGVSEFELLNTWVLGD